MHKQLGNYQLEASPKKRNQSISDFEALAATTSSRHNFKIRGWLLLNFKELGCIACETGVV